VKADNVEEIESEEKIVDKTLSHETDDDDSENLPGIFSECIL
jgi:hypothetical protein